MQCRKATDRRACTSLMIQPGMKMRFDKQKGQRLHKQFRGITNFSGMWWLHDSKRWVDKLPMPLTEIAGTTAPCRTLRAFRRHLKKHPNIKGKAILISRFVGFDVYA
jgi:hypothetical protein